ncbi:MAG: translocation/assembly module TamB domain-containing protein [Desulfovibrionaceae bacterium]|nr:translocation/assembly module TamB domain-containing protein [Desulfovibrionaceae bacterium]
MAHKEEKNIKEQAQEVKTQGTPRKRRRWLRALCFVLLGLVLVVVGILSAGLYYVRTDSGRKWLTAQINEALTLPLKAQGLEAKITDLAGDLPLEVRTGITVSDKAGQFFRADAVSFNLGFNFKPLGIELRELVIKDSHLERIPDLPKSAEVAEPTPPLTPEALHTLWAEINKSLEGLPTWLPEVHVGDVGLKNVHLGQSIVGFPLKVDLSLGLDFLMDEALKLPQVVLKLQECRLSSSALNLTADLKWVSGKKIQDLLQGELLAKLKCEVVPKALGLNLGNVNLPQPVKVDLELKGPLLTPKLAAYIKVEKAQVDANHLQDVELGLTAPKLNLFGFLHLGDPAPLNLHVGMAGKINSEPFKLSMPSFCELTKTSFAKLTAGVNKLSLEGFGVNLAASLKTQLGMYATPVFEGELTTNLPDARRLAKLIPGLSPSGSLKAEAKFSYSPIKTRAPKQDAWVGIDVPRFRLEGDKNSLVALDNLNLKLNLIDLLEAPSFMLDLASKSLQAGPLQIASQIKAQGSLTGAINLDLMTQGNLTTKVSATYAPGKVQVKNLEVLASPSLLQLAQNGASVNKNAARKTQSGRKAQSKSKAAGIGLRLDAPIEIAFGANGLKVSQTRLTLLPTGSLTARSSLNAGHMDMGFSLANFDLEAWHNFLPNLPTAKLNAELAVRGNPKAPSGSLKFGVTDFRAQDLPLEPIDVQLTGDLRPNALNLKLNVPPKTLRNLGLEELNLAASLPVVFAENGVPNLPNDRQMRAEVRALGKLAKITKLVPLPEFRLTGDMQTRVNVAGTLQALRFQGDVQLKNGRFEDPLNGILLRDMGLNVGVDGSLRDGKLLGGATIKGGLGDGMGGKVSIDGKAALDASSLDVTTKIERLRPLRRQDVRIQLSGETRVTGSATDPRVAGTIIVDNGAVQLENIATGPSGVTTLPIQKPRDAHAELEKTATKPAGAPFGQINLAIKSPGRFLLDGYGLASSWSTDLQIKGPLNAPVIAGEVNCVKGNLDFMDKNFNMEKGIVTLAGGNVANPIVDMLLTNTTNDFTSHIRISGPVKKLKLTLSSEPPMPQDDVLAQILFGRKANELGRYEALQLAAATARIASGFGSGLNSPRKALGMDVMRLKSGDRTKKTSEDAGVSGMALETGKYLTDSLYVGVEQGAKEGSTAGIVQLEITPRLKLELRSQQNNTSGSLNWKYNY